MRPPRVVVPCGGKSLNVHLLLGLDKGSRDHTNFKHLSVIVSAFVGHYPGNGTSDARNVDRVASGDKSERDDQFHDSLT